MLEIEIALDDTTGAGTVSEIELAEVNLPPTVSLGNMVANRGNASGLMVLEAADPVPPGTPAGTVILRKP